jgi:hypothetical protein
MNEQQAGLTLAEGVTRFHRAMSPLMRWDGWPVLDVRHLAYRRRPGKTLLAETDDVLGPLNEPANDYEDLRAGETLLSESFLSRVPEFDDEVADARLETGHAMLRQAIAATVAVRPLVCADRRDYPCFVHLKGKLDQALANRAMNIEEEWRGVARKIEEAIAHEKDTRGQTSTDDSQIPEDLAELGPAQRTRHRSGFTSDQKALANLEHHWARNRRDCSQWKISQWAEEVGCHAKSLSPKRSPLFRARLKELKARQAAEHPDHEHDHPNKKDGGVQ